MTMPQKIGEDGQVTLRAPAALGARLARSEFITLRFRVRWHFVGPKPQIIDLTLRKTTCLGARRLP